MRNRRTIALASIAAAGIAAAGSAQAQSVKHYRFAHDQQIPSGYTVAYDLFSAKLKELSAGTMLVDQFPGAQLGQEPQLLQLVKSGDIDFAIVSSANTATISPQAGVMSLHFLFRSEDHIVKVRVQATATEDTMFPAYGAQTVHMPFGSVYTSLQTGVVDFAENGVNVYLINRHYEVAPVLSMSEHEANNAIVWISDKLWQSLNAEERQWIIAAAREVTAKEPRAAFALEQQAAGKLKTMGVKIFPDVDKAGFQKIASPYLDKLAKELGPHAEKIKDLIRNIN